MDKYEFLPLLRELLQQQRWAALATLDRHGLPEGAMVAFVMHPDLTQGYLHLSELASHTRNLLQRPEAALVISAADDGEGDPQQLPRISLQISTQTLSRDSEDFVRAKTLYLSRLPDAEMRFDFADFRLLRFHWQKLRLVGGFAQACSFQPEDLQKLARVEK